MCLCVVRLTAVQRTDVIGRVCVWCRLTADQRTDLEPVGLLGAERVGDDALPRDAPPDEAAHAW